jgi:hypothetical protein
VERAWPGVVGQAKRTAADAAEKRVGTMSVAFAIGIVAQREVRIDQLTSWRSDLRSFRVSRRCPRSLQSAQLAPESDLMPGPHR